MTRPCLCGGTTGLAPVGQSRRRRAAMLEGPKSFAEQVMASADIPTARAPHWSDLTQ